MSWWILRLFCRLKSCSLSSRRSFAVVAFGMSVHVTCVASIPAQDANLRRFVGEYCHSCHNNNVNEGAFDVTELTSPQNRFDAATWQLIRDRVGAYEMPPADADPFPSEAERLSWLNQLDSLLAEGPTTSAEPNQLVTYRRLTNEEFTNTIFDLFGIVYPKANQVGLIDDRFLPTTRPPRMQDTISTQQLERYLVAAETIVDEIQSASQFQFQSEDLVAIDLAGGRDAFHDLDDRSDSDQVAESSVRLDLWPGQSFRMQNGPDRFGQPGRYRLTMTLSGLADLDGLAPSLVVRALPSNQVLAEHVIATTEEETATIEIVLHLSTETSELEFVNESPGPRLLRLLGEENRHPFTRLNTSRLPWQVPLVDTEFRTRWPLLIVDSLRWEGPLDHEEESPDDTIRPFATAPAALQREELKSWLERIFRRPVEDDELETHWTWLHELRASGVSESDARKTLLIAALTSSEFLLLSDGDIQQPTERLTDWQLATRLSYFLWCTTPDERLRTTLTSSLENSSHNIQSPAVRRRLADRMLEDPRVARMVDQFAQDWLKLDHVGEFRPNSDLYPSYSDRLERSMINESRLFLAEALRYNVPISDLVHSDWTIVNGSLAKHYQLSERFLDERRSTQVGVDRYELHANSADASFDSFRRIELELADHRGGLFTQASLLSLTSDGFRQRPVHRGVWFLETFYDRRSSPPPANVEPISSTGSSEVANTLRDRIEQHRRDPSCNRCHQRIDPYGFAFENYDAIGRYRNHERTQQPSRLLAPIDSSGSLPEGRSFENIDEFKLLLLDDLDLLRGTLLGQLAEFALRRKLTNAEEATLRDVEQAAIANGDGFRDLIMAFIESDLFLKR